MFVFDWVCVVGCVVVSLENVFVGYWIGCVIRE